MAAQGKESESEVAEVEDEVVFIPGPFAGLARFKQSIHQTLAWHLAAPGEMGLDVMAGRSGFRSKRLALSGRQIKPALLKLNLFSSLIVCLSQPVYSWVNYYLSGE